MPAKPLITYEDFSKLELYIATVVQAELVEGADKLLKLTLDVGEEGQRVVASGIKAWYAPEQLIGKQVVYLANLEPKMLRGVESQGMIIAAGSEEAVLIHPDKILPNGTIVR